MTDSVLWADRWAPVTSRIGFLRASVESVADGLLGWRRELHGSAKAKRLEGGLQNNIGRLEPLTGGVRPRELLVATRSPEWTAVFDCGIQGGDPVSSVGQLCRLLEAQGLAICSIPSHKASGELPGRNGARQFEMFTDHDTEFLNYVRTVSVVQDGSRWRFDANGEVQAFEDVSAYQRSRIADRFTPGMLADYAAALGVYPFDEDFYPGPCVLVSSSVPQPPGGYVMSLADARRFWGLDG